jgi:hypothetical protein
MRCKMSDKFFPNDSLIYRAQANSLATIPTILHPCKYLKNKYIFISIVMVKGYRTKHKIPKKANPGQPGDAKPRVPQG